MDKYYNLYQRQFSETRWTVSNWNYTFGFTQNYESLVHCCEFDKRNLPHFKSIVILEKNE